MPGLGAGFVKVDGTLTLSRLTSTGVVYLAAAKVAGPVELADAHLSTSTGYSLCADGLVVEHELNARRLRADGGIDLENARVGFDTPQRHKADRRRGVSHSPRATSASGRTSSAPGWSPRGRCSSPGRRWTVTST